VTYTKRTITNDVTSANKDLFDHIQTQYDESKLELDAHKADNANPHGVTTAQIGAEPSFTKNTAFNKNFGKTADTVLEGNAQAVDSAKLGGAVKDVASGANTIAQRDSAGDIHARLFRSEYDTTNVTENVNLIMTQIDSVSNNFIRPTTRRQLMEALEREGVETHRSGKDANGKFTTVEFKRQDGTLFMKSVLSGTVDANGNYPTRTETFYQVNGTTSIASIVYSRTFDADGDLLTEVF
jgi:hypothetical protein